MQGADCRRIGWLLVWVGLLGFGAAACGSRSEAISLLGDGGTNPNSAERCNGLDDDGKGGIDDPFRDTEGRYVKDGHCGACNQACVADPERELETHCRIVDDLPRCVAEKCAPGYAPARDGHCAEIAERLCLPCTIDADCGSLSGARCLSIGGETRCSVACQLGCPSGYVCDAKRDACLPTGGSCSCEKGERYDYACAPDDAQRDAGAPVCVGRARCDDGVVTLCKVAEETCDELDNDCDGLVDEGFRDMSGAYSLDPAHCGQCGASCLEDTALDQKLVCGGDPFAPRCSLACPDALNGIAVGDKLDGDLNIATGCECVVQKLNDEPGPVGAEGQLLDENCDGADGMVRESFYVAGDGDDSWPGSPTRPLRTIRAAIQRASDSLKSAGRRPHVFVASGAYTETLTLADGVQIHGGYRRDFRALDPAAYAVEVRAPRPSANGGAALVGIDVGSQPTRIEGMSLRGLDTAGVGPALGAYLERPGPNLVLANLTLQAGVPGDGTNGSDGAAGAGPSSAAGAGSPPRAARETPDHFCVPDGSNAVRGGSGGDGRCGGTDVSGGAGGSANCPAGQGMQPAGLSGRGPSAGAGGQGGQDAVGPLQDPMCPGGVCCGLADFTVPTNFEGPRPGTNGGAGGAGGAGNGCTDILGRFDGPVWSGANGNAGGDGQAGSGGGGGGSGGGGVLNWTLGLCEFADGLGGGGGGGGAGGCGGRGGSAGSSGAPSVSLLVIDDRGFIAIDNVFVSARGGR
ncbi:MAG TPA: MopE-related protein, partial [Polyangiales bacterium]